jgi:hypothetical protein
MSQSPERDQGLSESKNAKSMASFWICIHGVGFLDFPHSSVFSIERHLNKLSLQG